MPVEGPYSKNVFLQGQGPLLESEGRTLLVVPRISGRHLSQDGENQTASSSGDCSVGLLSRLSVHDDPGRQSWTESSSVRLLDAT